MGWGGERDMIFVSLSHNLLKLESLQFSYKRGLSLSHTDIHKHNKKIHFKLWSTTKDREN